jgi:hypothetical protein
LRLKDNSLLHWRKHKENKAKHGTFWRGLHHSHADLTTGAEEKHHADAMLLRPHTADTDCSNATVDEDCSNVTVDEDCSMTTADGDGSNMIHKPTRLRHGHFSKLHPSVQHAHKLLHKANPLMYKLNEAHLPHTQNKQIPEA